MSPYRKNLIQFLFAITLVVTLALSWGEGKLISWFTLPSIAAFSLYFYRDFVRAFFATFSMLFIHEGIWYLVATYGFGYQITRLMTNVSIFYTFLIFPLVLGIPYAWLYSKKRIFVGLGIYLGSTCVWGAFGFPISTLPTDSRYMELAPYFEIASWWAIFVGWFYCEYRRPNT